MDSPSRESVKKYGISGQVLVCFRRTEAEVHRDESTTAVSVAVSPVLEAS